MKLNDKRLTLHASLLLLLGYFLSFFLYYSANFLWYESEALTYVYMFVSRAFYILFPTLTAILLLVVYAFEGKRAYVSLIFFSLVRMIYFVPYFYLYFIYDGFSTAEAIPYAILTSVAEASLGYLIAILIALLMRYIVKRRGGKLQELIESKTPLDFSNPLSLSIATVSIIGFAYYFIAELVRVIRFAVEVSGSFTPTEIIFITFSFIFDIAMSAVIYISMSLVKALSVKNCCYQL